MEGWMEEIANFLNEILGSPRVFGADSWLEVFYWGTGALLAVMALIAFRQRVSQARATFLLQLFERWESLSEPRKKMHAKYEAIKKDFFKEQAEFQDQQVLENLRVECKIHVDRMRTKNKPLYDQLIQSLGFFEVAGVMVRNHYIPLRIIIQLYKGPIYAVDVMFRLHIEEWQNRKGVPPGLFENLLYLIKRTRRRDRIKSAILFWK